MLRNSYSSDHETHWSRTSTRSTSSSSDGVTGQREDRPVRGSHIERFREFSGTLVPSLPQGGQARTEIKADSRTAPKVVPIAAKKSDASSDQRSPGRWPHHQSVDTETRRATDQKEIRASLHPRWSLETDAPRIELELAKTRETGHPAKRTSDPTMEADRMAGYKKKPGDLTRKVQ